METNRPERTWAGLVILSSILVGLAIAASVPVQPPALGADTYWGTRVVPAPAPATKGLPLIPTTVHEGVVEGVPAHLEWYAYNGRENAPGIDPAYSGSNVFYYAAHPGRLQALDAEGIRPWWRELLGQPVHASDFPDVWKGAPAFWRSQNMTGEDVIPVIVMGVDPTVYPSDVASEFARNGFVAFAATDTHMGCTVWYETSPEPLVANRPPYVTIVDPCHDSMYDPREVQEFALPADEG